MEIKKDILWRVYLVYIAICVFALFILGKIFIVQFVEGETWKAKAKSLTTEYFDIEAVRGNIFDSEGNLLATSLPYYEVGMDVNTEYITDQIFNSSVDSLAICFSNMFKDKSTRDYVRLLRKARKQGDRFVLLKRDVSYPQLQEMKKFPILRKGRNKGGFVYTQINKRERPFQVLAARTIGYTREGVKPIGLEGAYDNDLKGVSGKKLMQKIAGGVWMPIKDNDDFEVKPQDGADLISTIDINIQDVAEHALLKQLIKNKAGYGCVILMEVKTGDIKAIANLTRKDSSVYTESFNYAIGSASEPGSTFKLASLLTAIEDGYTDIDDMVDLENGQHRYYDRVMKDSHEPEIRKVTVQRVFEISSNVGVSKIITQHYSKNPEKFVEGLKRLSLEKPLGLSIPGEGRPRIKSSKDKDWYGTSLPWMSIGYELLVTPMQTLTLYNAVANNGVMVKPRFIKEIRKRGETIKYFAPEVINPKICSQSTIDKVKKMLEGVVQNGTAKNLAGISYRVAGKTGTAQIANNGVYKNGTKVTYQASFTGYFPADNPKYTCIVIVNAPSNGIYYGNVVAGPIFKEIADKVYASSLEIHEEINKPKPEYAVKVPATKNGFTSELEIVAKELELPISSSEQNSEWAFITTTDSTKFKVQNRNLEESLKKGIMPNLIGMAPMDALYLLENNGLHVKLKGKGAITKQSVGAGEKINAGGEIILDLL